MSGEPVASNQVFWISSNKENKAKIDQVTLDRRSLEAVDEAVKVSLGWVKHYCSLWEKIVLTSLGSTTVRLQRWDIAMVNK